MVEALLVPEGAQCISLGAQTPIEDIRRATLAHAAHIVALSFSAAFPVRQAGDGLATLRRQLPAKIAIWAGGEMTRRIRKVLPGVLLVPDLSATTASLEVMARAVGRSAALRCGALIPDRRPPATPRSDPPPMSADDNAKKCRASATICRNS